MFTFFLFFHTRLTMIFYVFLLNYALTVVARCDGKSEFVYDTFYVDKELEGHRLLPRSRPYEDRMPECEDLQHTEATAYAAVILRKTSGNFLCMGSIIGTFHVLTVRECLLKDDKTDILVVAGYMSAWWGKNSQVKFVEEIIKSDEDLVILIVTRKFHLSRTVKPILLSGNSPSLPLATYGTTFGTIGFVRAPWDVPGEPMPKNSFYELRFVTGIFSESDITSCAAVYPDVSYNRSSMFCTHSNVSYCWGNLGAPTVILMDEELVQIGIVVRSFCDDRINPSLHYRIDSHQGWIRSFSDAKIKSIFI